MTRTVYPQHISVYQMWVRAVRDEVDSDTLSSWERSFMAHMEERIVDGGRLPTEAQAEALEKIYAEKTS